jgi:hypothetical protein
MNLSDTAVLAVVAATAVVPVAVVLIVIFVRGYSVNLSMHRPRHRRDRD